MAQINKQEVLQEMQEGLRLDTVREKTPNELAEKILPVYEVNPKGRIIQLEESAVNVNDRSFTVPQGKKWEVLFGHCSYVSSATVGNRKIAAKILDQDGSVLFQVAALNAQTASNTEGYTFAPCYAESGEKTTDFHTLPWTPKAILLENFSLQTLDINDVDDADDMVNRWLVIETDMNPAR